MCAGRGSTLLSVCIYIISTILRELKHGKSAVGGQMNWASILPDVGRRAAVILSYVLASTDIGKYRSIVSLIVLSPCEKEVPEISEEKGKGA